MTGKPIPLCKKATMAMANVAMNPQITVRKKVEESISESLFVLFF